MKSQCIRQKSFMFLINNGKRMQELSSKKQYFLHLRLNMVLISPVFYLVHVDTSNYIKRSWVNKQIHYELLTMLFH